MKNLAAGKTIDEFNTADFDQPIAFLRVKTGRFRVKDHFTHYRFPWKNLDPNQARRCGIVATRARMVRTCARAASNPCEVSTTKSARFRFSLSGNWRERIA